MKKIFLLLSLSAITFLFVACESEAPLESNDQYFIDTLIQTDTLIQIEIQVDTIIKEIIITPDTIRIIDTLPPDTVTQTLIDSVFIIDTVIQNDTVTVWEYIYVTDTLWRTDTLYQIQVIYETDTLYMNNVVHWERKPWLLRDIAPRVIQRMSNPEGEYELLFNRERLGDLPTGTQIKVTVEGNERIEYFGIWGAKHDWISFGPILFSANARIKLEVAIPVNDKGLSKVTCLDYARGNIFVFRRFDQSGF